MRRPHLLLCILALAACAPGGEDPGDDPLCLEGKCDAAGVKRLTLGDTVQEAAAGCSDAPAPPPPALTVRAVNGGLRIAHASLLQSAARIQAQAVLDGDTIRVVERDVSLAEARCASSFRISIDVCGGLEPGAYQVEVIGPKGDSLGKTAVELEQVDRSACLAAPLDAIPIGRADFPGVCADLQLAGFGDRLSNPLSATDPEKEYALTRPEADSAELQTDVADWLNFSTLVLEDAAGLFKPGSTYRVMPFEWATARRTVPQGLVWMIRDDADREAFAGKKIGPAGAPFTPSGATAFVYYFTEQPRQVRTAAIPCRRVTDLRPDLIEPETCYWLDARRRDDGSLPICF